MTTTAHPHHVLSDATLHQLHDTSVQELRLAIANRYQTGCHIRQHNYARAVEEAVLQVLQEDIEQARRYQALIQHHGPQILAKVFGIACQTPEQAARHLDQIAEEALAANAVVRAMQAAKPHQRIDIARDYPLLDLDLGAIRTTEQPISEERTHEAH